MNIQYCMDMQEVMQYSFLDDYVLEQLKEFSDCFALWYYDDEFPVSILLYGIKPDKCAYLLYMATKENYQMQGYISYLMENAEEKLANIGIKQIWASVCTDDEVIASPFSCEGKEEFLEYFGFTKQDKSEKYIAKYKDGRGKILQGMTPHDFLNNINTTNEIVTDKEIYAFDAYIEQLNMANVTLAENEQGLFAINNGKIKTGIIFIDSKLYDINLVRIINFSENANYIGSLLTTYIVTHGTKKEGEFIISSTADLDISVMNNILGNPIDITNVYSFIKKM